MRNYVNTVSLLGEYTVQQKKKVETYLVLLIELRSSKLEKNIGNRIL